MLSQSIQESISTYDVAQRKLKELQESASDAKGVGISSKRSPLEKRYSKNKMLQKAQNDAVFFEHVYSEYVKSSNPAVKNVFDNLITEAMVAATKIYEEIDVQPRTVSAAVDYSDVISESEVVEHYKRSFNMILEQEFNKPNLKSELIYEMAGDGNGCQARKIIGPGVKGMIVKCVKNGVLDENDPETAIKYLAAENAVSNGIANTFIPFKIMNLAQERANSLPEDYTNLFGNTLADNIAKFKAIISKIAAILAPFIFMNALTSSGLADQVKFNPARLAGIGMELNNQEPDADDDVDIDDDDGDAF